MRLVLVPLRAKKVETTNKKRLTDELMNYEWKSSENDDSVVSAFSAFCITN